MKSEMVIDGVTWVPRDTAGEIKIMILQRGFVYVGRVSREGTQVRISNAHNIRQWGTTKGLGEIAAAGPTASTKLDPAGTVGVHELGVVAELNCNQSAWESLCK